MDNKQIYKENINLINDTMIDARFILDDAKPRKGICKTLLNWCFSFFIISLILSIIPEIAQYMQWIESPNYFSIYRLLIIFFYTIPLIVYIICMFRIDMTLKEIAFLKTFMYIPISISMFKMLFPLSYYLNFNFLLSLYDTIPIDMIFLTFGLIQLYSYFKNRNIIIIIILSIMYIFFFSVIKIITFQQIELSATLLFCMKIRNYIDVVNNYSVFLVGTMLVSIFLIKCSNEK